MLQIWAPIWGPGGRVGFLRGKLANERWQKIPTLESAQAGGQARIAERGAFLCFVPALENSKRMQCAVVALQRFSREDFLGVIPMLSSSKLSQST